MPFEHALWVLDADAKPLRPGRLEDERQLEGAIEADASILSDEWLIVGRQVPTDHGGFVDLLAVDPAGTVIVIELKRDKTPRDVVAQALDYASWAESLGVERLASIYRSYAERRGNLPDSLDEAFRERFESAPPEETGSAHQVVVVAAELDASTERIVEYLAERDVPLNVAFFQVFDDGGRTILSRVWLRDLGETQENAQRARAQDSWNGEYYVSFGHDETRDWEDARQYGFVSAGGGDWYTRTLYNLEPGARVWVHVPQEGFVGAGIVEDEPVEAKDFVVRNEAGEQVPLSAVPLRNPGLLRLPDGESEVVVPVRWLHTLPIKEAVWETGFFANQNTVCAPRTPSWRFTVDRLKRYFALSD